MATPEKASTSSLRAVITGEVLALMGRHRTTQKRLALAVGISQPQLSQRLNLTVAWRVDELEAIAAHFDVPVTQLLGAATRSTWSSPLSLVSGTIDLRDPQPELPFPPVLSVLNYG